MAHPYKGLDDYCFWTRAMSAPAPGHIDPVTAARIITPDEKVATMGSCFAQHIARHISKSGLNYYVTEQAPAGVDDEEAKRRNYGVFSARYGNLYTVRQALQLFDRAFGRFDPIEYAWERSDGRWVDAFRPQVEPDGYASADEVRHAIQEHLAHVREVFMQSQWIVFTMGLTEGWRSRLDGAVFPLAPGVSGGSYDPDRHEFINFSMAEAWEDLDAFIQRIQSVNPDARMLLTVSPVALMATYERRHVLSSTVCSKSVLRVAADQAERKYPHVIYFPSYEIITSPASAGRYYEDDLRQVTELGVSHVMRVFSKHFMSTDGVEQPQSPSLEMKLQAASTDVVCDEEAINEAIKDSGLRGKI